MLSAYNIRKILPRLLVAAIAIQLSWYLMIEIIHINNAIAHGLEALIYTPFGGAQTFTLQNLVEQSGNSGQFAGVGLFSLVAAGGAYVAIGSGTVVGILALAGTALLGIIVAVFTLILRRAVLIFLIVAAPLAIVAWILPGTERFFKLWWESFSKLLLMYPLILLFIATGRLFAYMAANTGGNEFVGFAMIVLGFFGPLLMIPATMKLAGTAFTALTGAVNSRNKGAFDRLKGVRAKEAERNLSRSKTGDRFQGRNAVASWYNKRSSGLAGGAKAGFGFGKRGEAYHDIHGRHAGEEAIRNNAMLRQLAFDDNGIAVMALSGGTRAGAERAATALGLTGDARDRALQSAAAVGFNSSNTVGAITLMGQNKSRALNGALAGDAGMELVRQSATEVSGGNRQMTENLMGGFAYHSRNAGRLDLGGETTGSSMLAGWQRSSVAQHAQAFGESTRAYADSFANTIQTGSVDEKRAAAVALSEMQNSLPMATAENQAHINAAMASIGIDHDLVAQGVSVEQQLANIANGVGAAGIGPTASGGPLRDAQGNVLAGPVAGAPVISAAEIQGMARQYGSAVPVGQRGDPTAGQQPPQQPQPGAEG